MAVPTMLILTLGFLHVPSVSAYVDPGSTLSTNDDDAWRSPSGDFAFGFRQLNGTDKNTNMFMLAIWYDQIPDKTVVWSARKTDSVLATAPTGSKVRLTQVGLSLMSPEGVSIWTAQPNNNFVSHGAMLDTGNFVLVNKSSTFVWESFLNATDTLLPSQSLELNGKLISGFSESNYSGGKFQLYVEGGNVSLSVLAWPSPLAYPPYRIIDASGSASRLVFNESGDIYVETTNKTRIQLQGQTWPVSGDLNLDPKAYYYRATIDFYGVFTQYSYRKNSTSKQNWTFVRYVPEDICNDIFSELGSPSCGYNSICSMETYKPACKCPDGYSLLDPSNPYGGCQPNFTIGCGPDFERLQALPEPQYTFQVVRDVNFPLGDYEKLEPYNAEECRKSCLQDCMCAVAILGGETCWKKRLPLTNGRLVKGNVLHFVYIKTRVNPLNISLGDQPPSGPYSMKKDGVNPVLLGLLIGSSVINTLLMATVILVLLLKLKVKRIVQATSLLETNLHSFTYEALKEVTWGFSEELGRGSFGIVYKGKLEAAPYSEVAVKRLDRLAQEREREFRTELSAIGKTCHKNLVRLIGFCDEGINRLLVYEFMSNGTLADILFGQPKPIWSLRVRFALGIAKGLAYLHEECGTPIIHCDIKPQNILIDEHFTAKISDFGLAKLLLADQSRTNTMIRGTRGYVAPEWFKNVPVTVKVDVYSFGVMLLEIICCRRSVLPMESGEEEKAILTDWAYDCYVAGRVDALVENDMEALADIGRLKMWVKIAIWCIQEHHEMRPPMALVLQMLEGFAEVPDPPAFISSYFI